jgi:hypothetical protein
VPLTDHVALVSLTGDVSSRSLMQVAAAIQKQVARDFAPIWGLHATVDAFDDLDSVPSDYHPVVVFGDDPDELVGQLSFAIGEQNAARLLDLFEGDRLEGLHLSDLTRQPFSLVAASETWSVTASHEVLEMLSDPFGNRLRAAAHPTDPEQRVRYLLEVCDPCQSMWYSVNGWPVTDFYTPEYLDPVRLDGGRYSFTGELKYPLHILDGGYLTWIDPSDSGLYQLQGDESEPVLLFGLMELARTNEPLRTLVDTNPRTPRTNAASLRPASSAPASSGSYRAVLEASEGTALRVREAIASLAAGAE